MRSRDESASKDLFQIAEQQQGYFTAKQAAGVGYKLGSQAHHVKSANWLRVERGIYRLSQFPQSNEEQLVIYALWSRNIEGKQEGVYSHQTALSIHDLSDANPSKLHITVPARFRRRAKIPGTLVLHHADLRENDVEQRQGFTVTRPLRTITDLVESGAVSREIIQQAVMEGRKRGLITGRDISDLRRKSIAKWFDELLDEKLK